MAHGDYDCCAVCDRKMAYNSGDARTKETLCPECAVDLAVATGRKILTGGQLIQWIEQAGAAVAVPILNAMGYEFCFYGNEVDQAVTRARASLVPTPGDGE